MPLLDVSSLLTDPDVVDVFDVTRRVQIVDNHGRTGTADKIFPRILGVVTMSSPTDLDRSEDFQVTSRSIQIVCKFALSSESTGSQPDIVRWRGSNYIVRHVDLYPQFGQGFFQAECESTNKTDVTLLGGYNPQLLFTQPSNAIFAALG